MMLHLSAAVLRLTFFLGLLATFMLAEAFWPRQRGRERPWRRWPANLGLAVAGSLSVQLLGPTTAVAAAVWAQAHEIGLLHALPLPATVQWVLTLLALDALIYGQHRVMHRWSPLWRLHRVHHTDIALDASSALRFHPLEIVLSMLLKALAVVLLGAPVGAVLAFEILLNGLALFNHANLALPVRLDRWLCWVIVTPDMHRIHHRPAPAEHDRNFGFNLSCWDRLFGSYRDQPAAPQASMTLGLDQYRSRADQTFGALLLQPWRKEAPTLPAPAGCERDTAPSSPIQRD